MSKKKRRIGKAKRETRRSWRLPEALWIRLQPLLPRYQPSPRGGRPRVDLKQVARGVFYVLRTGCQWKAVPAEYGSGSTLHRYYQEWAEAGVFRKLWKASLVEYDELKGLQWNWQSVDGAMTKSPLGGEKYGQEPHRPRQARCETLGAHRRAGRPAGGGG